MCRPLPLSCRDSLPVSLSKVKLQIGIRGQVAWRKEKPRQYGSKKKKTTSLAGMLLQSDGLAGPNDWKSLTDWHESLPQVNVQSKHA